MSASAAPAKWFEIRNESSSKHTDILIYDRIGKSWWDDSGVGAKEFAESLKTIPTDHTITVAINSPGGNVFDGLAIYHQLQARRSQVTTRVDGIAASIASVIALAGKEVRMPKGAMMMIHDPWSIAMGTAEEMRKVASSLDMIKKSLAGIYHSKNGKPLEEIHKKMSDETWFTGSDAKEFGLADVVTDDSPITANLDAETFRLFRHAPSAIRPVPAIDSPPPTRMAEPNAPAAPAPAAPAPITEATFMQKAKEFFVSLISPAATPPPPAPAAPDPVAQLATANATIEQLRNDLAAEQEKSKKLPEQIKAEGAKAATATLASLHVAPIALQPDGATASGGKQGKIEEYQAITDPVAKTEFYRKHKAELMAEMRKQKR